MNKKDLTDALADKSDLTKVDAAAILDDLTSIISKELKSGGEVQITGFGTFSITKRAARTGRNPRTGEAIKIKASKAPKFKAGKTLKDLVR